MNRDDLQQIARVRVSEARALLDAGYFDGAYYLSGYAIECALKACIAKQTKRFDFPDKAIVLDSYNHDLSKLLKTAGLKSLMDQAQLTDPLLAANWTTTKDWNEQSRYSRWTQFEAHGLLTAVSDTRHGVFRWLRQHW